MLALILDMFMVLRPKTVAVRLKQMHGKKRKRIDEKEPELQSNHNQPTGV
jgi:hypothetical protein